MSHKPDDKRVALDGTQEVMDYKDVLPGDVAAAINALHRRCDEHRIVLGLLGFVDPPDAEGGAQIKVFWDRRVSAEGRMTIVRDLLVPGVGLACVVKQ